MTRNILAGVLAIGFLSFSAPAFAGMISDTNAEASAIAAQVKNNTSYHGLLAKKFAFAAMEEVGQNDTQAAKAFVQLARSAAAKAEGDK